MGDAFGLGRQAGEVVATFDRNIALDFTGGFDVSANFAAPCTAIGC